MADIQNTDEAARIRAVLKDHPLGMSIKEISAAVNMSRNSVAKYVEVMATAGQLDVRHVGNAKLYNLSHRVPVGDLLNHAKELIVVLDNDLRIIQVSDSFCRFAGITKEAALHSRLSTLPLPLLSPAEEQEMAALLAGGPAWKKAIHVSQGSREAFFDSRFIPAVLESGLPGITLILEDTTERVNALRSSQERERLLSTLFQIPTSPQFFIDRNHKVVYWDRALEILTGVKSEDVVGTGDHWKAFYSSPRACLADLVVDGNREMIVRQYSGTCNNVSGPDGKYECTDFFPDMLKGGRWLRITASLIRDTSGNITGAMETVEDVTNSRKGHFVVQHE